MFRISIVVKLQFHLIIEIQSLEIDLFDLEKNSWIEELK